MASNSKPYERELWSRSFSQCQNMGNNASTFQTSASPHITSLLPKTILEMTVKVKKMPNLASVVYGDHEQIDNDVVGIQKDTSAEEEEVPLKSIVMMQDFTQVGEDEKLNLLMMAINKLNTTFQVRLLHYSPS